eukprot:354518-Chlamydomonas_euryale.AAC.7
MTEMYCCVGVRPALCHGSASAKRSPRSSLTLLPSSLTLLPSSHRVYIRRGDDDLPFQDTKTGQVDCSWLHNSVKIMDRWPHIGVLGVRNYVTW